MYEGQITGFRSPDVPVSELGRLMAGGSDDGFPAVPGPSDTPATPATPAAPGTPEPGDPGTSTPAPGAGQ
jgi:hypothetical protein